jgi:hypothetical protein
MTAHQRRLSLRGLVAVLLAGATALAAVPGLASPPNIPHAEAMRAKVEKLGVGEHVMVKLAEGPKLHGHIVGIDPQAFQLKPDNAQAAIVIPYDHVLKVKKNPGAITWMLIGAALVIIIIVATTR